MINKQGFKSSHQKEFLKVLNQISQTDKINYFNFLLAAKKMNYRFSHIDHLLNIKNLFMQRGGSLDKKLLLQMLQIRSQIDEGRIFVYFRTQFNVIKQQQHQDQQQQAASNIQLKQNAIALKLQDLQKRLTPLQQALKILIDQKKFDLLQIFDIDQDGKINFTDFDQSLSRLASYKNSLCKQDRMLLFKVLGHQYNNKYLQSKQLQQIMDLSTIRQHLASCYSQRINQTYLKQNGIPDFKSKDANKIFLPLRTPDLQIFQKEKASQNENKLPFVFGICKPRPLPVKQRKSRSKANVTLLTKPDQKPSQLQTQLQRTKIQKILRAGMMPVPISRQIRAQTTASRLLILPRQQIFQQLIKNERKRVGKNRSKNIELPIKGLRAPQYYF